VFKYSKQSISLDEVSVIPESVTTYSDSDVDLSVQIRDLTLGIPVIGAAMDSVMCAKMLTELQGFGGIGIVNLCGLISRYELIQIKSGEYVYMAEGLQESVANRIAQSPTIKTLQGIYNSHPINTEILQKNLETLREQVGKSEFAVSATPQQAERLFDIALRQGIRTYAIQSSFISPYWSSAKSVGLNVGKFIQYLHQHNNIVMVGNVASLNAAVPFIEAGVDAIIEGVGPGVQCTTRFVLGIGAGHITTIDDLREYIEKQKSSTKIIADGGIHNSGDIVKLLCCGANAVILGGMLAKTVQAPFLGYHWGMSAYHNVLPRGDLLHYPNIQDSDTVGRLLYGPSEKADGTQALIPALTNAFSNLGCKNINSAYRDTLVLRFAGVKTEGKDK
jgi:IMP dehydrogenase